MHIGCLLVAVAVALPVSAATYCVDSVADPGTGVATDCAQDCVLKNGGKCSLANALLLANSTPGRDTIAFSIAGAGARIISLNGPLPAVTDPVSIDGYTEPLTSFWAPFRGATLRIVVKNNVPVVASAITVLPGGSGSLIRGLAMGGFGTAIIISQGATGVRVSGNYLGTNVGGTLAVPGSGGGVLVAGDDNVVGGVVTAEANLISGNAAMATSVGVDITGNSNLVVGNIVGLGFRGLTPVPNGIAVRLTGQHNVIGGVTAARRNQVGASLLDDIIVAGNFNTVSGNWLGLDSEGLADPSLGCGGNGVSVLGAHPVVGGATAAEGNVVCGSALAGIAVDGGDATISNNLVGVDFNGQLLGNGEGIVIDGAGPGPFLIEKNAVEGNGLGVLVQNTGHVTLRGNLLGNCAGGSFGNIGPGLSLVGTSGHGPIVVGGNLAAEGNVISGNGQQGAALSSADAVFTGNLIGLGAGGERCGNQGAGIAASGTGIVQIGTPGHGNVIAANLVGLELGTSTGVQVIGNSIGTDATGQLDAGNLDAGVVLTTSGHTIGGSSDAGNLIAFNGGSGVSGPGALAATVLGNAIYFNAGLGLDFGPAGVSANDDSNESDDTFNFPTLTAATGNGDSVSIQGTLDTTAHSAVVRVEFFDAQTCDGSGNGQGQAWLASQDVSTDASGRASFSQQVMRSVPDGHAVTATATSLAAGMPGRTSEFSACRTLAKHGTFAFSAAAVTGREESGLVTLTITRADGALGSASVDVATAAGTATSGTDFTPLATTVAFADGQSSQDVAVVLLDDALADDGETFTAQLTNPQGGASLGSSATVTVTISDTDPAPTPDAGQTDAGTDAGSIDGGAVVDAGAPDAGHESGDGGDGGSDPVPPEDTGCGCTSPGAGFQLVLAICSALALRPSRPRRPRWPGAPAR